MSGLYKLCRVNAAEQAINLDFASKIATVVRIFKGCLPDLKADLKPWASDQDTQALVDPDSIDIGFHFPGVSRLFRCRSLLVQIRLYRDPVDETHRVIGLEVGGFDHRGKQWNLSTIEHWQFTGNEPDTVSGQQVKQCCRQVLELFNPSANPRPEDN